MSFPAARYLPGIFGKATRSRLGTTEDSAVSPESETGQPLVPEGSLLAHVSGASVRVESPAEESDEAIVARICARDEEALACLFRRHARLVRAVAYRILRDEAEADDLLQEVFLFIQRKCQTFDAGKGSARSWIVNLAYERAIDRRRYLNTRHFYTSLSIDDAAIQLADPRASVAERDAALDAMLAKHGLEGALAALSETQRDTLRLYFFEGLTLNEIAIKLEQSLGNVRNHYYRGLERLRNQLLATQLRRR